MVIGERRSVQQNQRQSAGAQPIEQDSELIWFLFRSFVLFPVPGGEKGWREKMCL